MIIQLPMLLNLSVLPQMVILVAANQIYIVRNMVIVEVLLKQKQVSSASSRRSGRGSQKQVGMFDDPNRSLSLLRGQFCRKYHRGNASAYPTVYNTGIPWNWLLNSATSYLASWLFWYCNKATMDSGLAPVRINSDQASDNIWIRKIDPKWDQFIIDYRYNNLIYFSPPRCMFFSFYSSFVKVCKSWYFLRFLSSADKRAAVCKYAPIASDMNRPL